MESFVQITKGASAAFDNIYSTSGNATAASGDEIWVDSSSAAVTITLPSSPSTGASVTVFREGANTVTVARNGATIMGLSEDFTIDRNGYGVTFRYLLGTWKAELRSLAV